MRKIKYVIMCVFLSTAIVTACEKESQILTETVGALSVQAIIGPFVEIDLLADLYLNGIYDFETVSEGLTRIVQMNTMIIEHYNILLREDILEQEDISFVNELSNINTIINEEASMFTQYMQTDTEEDYNIFLNKRNLIESRLSKLFGG